MEPSEMGSGRKKKIFVVGATGTAGKSIVEKLLAKGFAVKAGVRNLDKAKIMFPSNNPHLQFVKCDVTEDSTKLGDAIGDDSNGVICTTGALTLLAPWKVDYCGTVKLIEACKTRGVDRFILISSILVNGAAMPNLIALLIYLIVNLFGLILILKFKAERYLINSGLNYTILRPGWITKESPTGNILIQPQDTLTYGYTPREQLAEAVVEALLHSEANYKVMEIIARDNAPKLSSEELFTTKKDQ